MIRTSETLNQAALRLSRSSSRRVSSISLRSQTEPGSIWARVDHVVVEARGDMKTKAGVRYENEYCLIYRLKTAREIADRRASFHR